MKRLFLTLLVAVVFISANLRAQDGRNQVNYGTLAQQFSGNNSNGDATSAVLPSVALANGFGTYLDNPAATALIDDSYFSIGYYANQTNSENTYLGDISNTDGGLGRLSNIGVIYSAPTLRGSLVFGGGYTLNNSVNRRNYFSAKNTSYTITDEFKNPGSQYYDIAFNTFAIDYYDVEQTQLESIFRIGFTPSSFPGIYQDAEIINTSNTGEFSFFVASEFLKNVFMGASVAVVTGNHSYTRNFLESDLDNVYNGDFLFADEYGEGGTDVHSVLLNDQIDSEILGSSIRLGFLNKVSQHFSIGASYLLPTKLYITEKYSSFIRTTFDDASTSEDFFSGDFSYEIRKPAQFNFGLALVDLNGLSISTSSEWINYGSTEVFLTTDPDLAFEDIAYLKDEEDLINLGIDRDYTWVTNIKAGAVYDFSQGVEVRLGGGWLPGKSREYSADKWYMAGGLGIALSRDIYLDVSSQYSQWNDRSVIYEFATDDFGATHSELVDEKYSQFNILVGLKFKF